MNVLLAGHTLSVHGVCMMSHFSFAIEDLGEVVVSAGSLQCPITKYVVLFTKVWRRRKEAKSYAVMSSGKAQIRLVCLRN